MTWQWIALACCGCHTLYLLAAVAYACLCVSGNCAQREEDAGIARRS